MNNQIILIILLGVVLYGLFKATWIIIPVLIIGVLATILLSKKKLLRLQLSPAYKAAILDIYNNECSICKSNISLEVHHRDSNNRNPSIENLIVLCHDCHRKLRKNK